MTDTKNRETTDTTSMVGTGGVGGTIGAKPPNPTSLALAVVSSTLGGSRGVSSTGAALDNAWTVLASLPASVSDASLVWPVVRAAGELVAMGQPDAVTAFLSSRANDESRGKIDRWVLALVASGGLGFDRLENASLVLIEGLERVASDENASIEIVRDELIDALKARDDVERALLGLRALSRVEISLDAEDESQLLAFDELVRPLVWKLTSLNDDRARALEGIAPTLRANHWWWSEGVGIPAGAVASLPAVALLIAQYPEAREVLDRMVRAQEVWRVSGGGRRAARTTKTAKTAEVDEAVEPIREHSVIPFATWARRRARPSAESAASERSPDAESELSMAAAPLDHEVLLVDGEEVQVSLRARDLLVIDVIADRSDALPTVALADGRQLTLEAVPGAIERFSARLDQAALDGDWLEVSVPLVAGRRRLRLPPDGAA